MRLRPPTSTGRQESSHVGVNVAGLLFAPHESFHAAHGSADEQANVIHLQAVFQQHLCGFEHVSVVVVREFGAQAVAGLGGFAEAAAELVGKDDVILGGVEQLAGAE